MSPSGLTAPSAVSAAPAHRSALLQVSEAAAVHGADRYEVEHRERPARLRHDPGVRPDARRVRHDHVTRSGELRLAPGAGVDLLDLLLTRAERAEVHAADRERGLTETLQGLDRLGVLENATAGREADADAGQRGQQRASRRSATCSSWSALSKATRATASPSVSWSERAASSSWRALARSARALCVRSRICSRRWRWVAVVMPPSSGLRR
jgi:hypothetical protein